MLRHHWFELISKIYQLRTLCKKCPYSELFWSALFWLFKVSLRIQFECGPEYLQILTLFTQWGFFYSHFYTQFAIVLKNSGILSLITAAFPRLWPKFYWSFTFKVIHQELIRFKNSAAASRSAKYILIIANVVGWKIASASSTIYLQLLGYKTLDVSSSAIFKWAWRFPSFSYTSCSTGHNLLPPVTLTWL